MNVPKPCCFCKNLYYDAMQKDSPNCFVECWKGHKLGGVDCPDFIPDNDESSPSRIKRTELIAELKDAQERLHNLACAVQECLHQPLLNDLDSALKSIGKVEEYLYEADIK